MYGAIIFVRGYGPQCTKLSDFLLSILMPEYDWIGVHHNNIIIFSFNLDSQWTLYFFNILGFYLLFFLIPILFNICYASIDMNFCFEYSESILIIEVMPICIYMIAIFKLFFCQPELVMIFIKLNYIVSFIANCIHLITNYGIIGWHHIFSFYGEIASLLKGVIIELVFG